MSLPLLLAGFHPVFLLLPHPNYQQVHLVIVIVIPSDGELMGNNGILSIKLNGITIYQSCVDGLLPQRMINDNIVSLLME